VFLDRTHSDSSPPDVEFEENSEEPSSQINEKMLEEQEPEESVKIEETAPK
jgi:hypothetical protein